MVSNNSSNNQTTVRSCLHNNSTSNRNILTNLVQSNLRHQITTIFPNLLRNNHFEPPTLANRYKPPDKTSHPAPTVKIREKAYSLNEVTSKVKGRKRDFQMI
jgi:hypothetical protein